jgi:putative membrane protein
MGWFAWLMMVLFWGTIVALIAWALRSASTGRSESAPDAISVLERRYAAGEIDRDEFEERRRVLVGSRGDTESLDREGRPD